MKDKLIDIINNNQVIGHTTDTVFGLLLKINRENIYTLNKLKGRQEDKPLQVLISNIEQARDIVKDVSILENNMKAKTSYIVEANEQFINNVLLDSFNKTVMVKLATAELKELIETTGPLFATSANINGQKEFVSYLDVENTFNIETNKEDQVEGKASTIISLLNNEIKVIRQ